MTDRWKAQGRDGLSWREWDGELVVHNQATGATHLLAAQSGAILRLVTDSPAPLSSEEIASAIGSRPEIVHNVGIVEIDEVLSELQRIGLLTRVVA